MTSAAVAATADNASATAEPMKTADKRGKLWRGGGARFGTPSGSTMGGAIPRTSSGRSRGSASGSSPPIGSIDKGYARGEGTSMNTGTPSTGGDVHHGLWRKRSLRKTNGADSSGNDNGASLITTPGVPDTARSDTSLAETVRCSSISSGSLSTGSSQKASGTDGDRQEHQGTGGRSGLPHKRSLPVLGKPRRSWRRGASEPVVLASLSPTPRNARLWSADDNEDTEEGNKEAVADTTEAENNPKRQSSRLGRSGRTGGGSCNGNSSADGGGGGDGGRGAKGVNPQLETVAKPPPWMEGVEASATYEEMKPALDVIKRTVLLAVLQQVGTMVGSGGPGAGSRGERRLVLDAVFAVVVWLLIACRMTNEMFDAVHHVFPRRFVDCRHGKYPPLTLHDDLLPFITSNTGDGLAECPSSVTLRR